MSNVRYYLDMRQGNVKKSSGLRAEITEQLMIDDLMIDDTGFEKRNATTIYLRLIYVMRFL